MKVNIFKNGQHVSTKEFSDPRIEFVRTFNGTNPGGTTKAVIVRTSEEKLKENILRLRYLWLPMSILFSLVLSSMATVFAVSFIAGEPTPAALLATETASDETIDVQPVLIEPYDHLRLPVRSLPGMTAAYAIDEPFVVPQPCYLYTVEVLVPRFNRNKGYHLQVEVIDQAGNIVSKSFRHVDGEKQDLRLYEVLKYQMEQEQILPAGEYALRLKTISGPAEDSGHYVRVATFHCGTKADGTPRQALAARITADLNGALCQESCSPSESSSK